MKYKSEVGKTLDNTKDQVSNLIEQLERSAITEQEVIQFLGQVESNVERIDNLVSLEDNDFEQTSDAPAPGSVEAPTPNKQSRKEENNYQTRRVEDEDQKQTKRIDTDGGHSHKKKQTKRVEFDDN